MIIFLNFILFFEISVSYESSGRTDDPFKSLGIPDLNPKQILEDLDSSNKQAKNEEAPKLMYIQDLPNFLKNPKISEEYAIKVLSKFLLQDDINLKKYGVVYDQSGFDGIQNTEKISQLGTEERLVQRARSAAKIWVNLNKFFSYFYYLYQNIILIHIKLKKL